MALVKTWHFFHILNIGKIADQNLFECILERKKASPDYKDNKLKKWKLWDFSKGVSPWLWLKTRNFSIFLL